MSKELCEQIEADEEVSKLNYQSGRRGGMMIKKLLIKLVMKAYKMGVDNERKGCDADYATFERLVAQILD